MLTPHTGEGNSFFAPLASNKTPPFSRSAVMTTGSASHHSSSANATAPDNTNTAPAKRPSCAAQVEASCPSVRPYRRQEPGYQDEWVVSEPAPRDGEFRNGDRGSGEFVVPADGPIVAPLYQAASFAPSRLIGVPLEAMVLDWELPHRCLCRMTIRYVGGSSEWIVYSVGPFSLRDVKGLYQGRFRYWLDCFPEIASVDDVLDPVRAPRFAAQAGRLARVQTVGTFEVR